MFNKKLTELSKLFQTGLIIIMLSLTACGVENEPKSDGNSSETIDEGAVEDGDTDEGASEDSGTEADGEVGLPPAAANVSLTFEAIKLFRFNWSDVDDATHYQLLENVDGISGFVPVGDAINSEIGTTAIEVPLYARINAEYILQACNEHGCTDSDTVFVEGTMLDSIGYLKASNTEAKDSFGSSLSLSGDGKTLAIGAQEEDSGLVDDQTDNSGDTSGAVYLFNKTVIGTWVQTDYLKPSTSSNKHRFGSSVSLSADGSTLAVGARGEDSNVENAGAVFIFNLTEQQEWTESAFIQAEVVGSGDEFGSVVSLSSDGTVLAVSALLEDSSDANDASDNSAVNSGAVYVFQLESEPSLAWVQKAYLKASHIDLDDRFGSALSLSGDGSTLVVGMVNEDSLGLNDPDNNDAVSSGAAYVFTQDDSNQWTQQAFLKASNNEAGDQFGVSVSVNDDGTLIAIGANFESSNATTINGDETDNSANRAGAAYIFSRDLDGDWSQDAYLKASNARAKPLFGQSLALNAEGNLLAIGAPQDRSTSEGVNASQSGVEQGFGATFVFSRDIAGQWQQQAYLKSTNSQRNDRFGNVVALSGDGSVIAVNAPGEDSNAVGINGDQDDNSFTDSGAVYLY
jgi:hypothetical protein